MISARRFIKRLLSAEPGMRAASASTVKRAWSIGVYVGGSPFNLAPPENLQNPVLTPSDVTDVQALLVADPFMVRVDRTWHMFFEVIDQQTSKGSIGLAISGDGLKWTYQRIVLDESFHLSYPYVFQVGTNYYMLPESYQRNSIRLYKAVHFPTQWSFVGTLLTGQEYVDPSIFYYGDKWWLFSGLGARPLRADSLRLYHADELLGPWFEHPRSPIILGNERIARPAGRVLVDQNGAIRYAQDCYPTYGTKVRAFEITGLTTTSYHEREVDESPILFGSGVGWNAGGMHHVDPHPLGDGRWIACVDGWVEYSHEDCSSK